MRYALALLVFVVGFSFCGGDEKFSGPIQFGTLLCDGDDSREVFGPERKPVKPSAVASPSMPSGIFQLGSLLAIPNSDELLPADDPSRLIAYAHKVKKKQPLVAVDIAHVILGQGENSEAWKLLEVVEKSGAPSRRLIELVKARESCVGYEYLSRLYKSESQEEQALFCSERAEGHSVGDAHRVCARYCMNQSEKEGNKAALFLANSKRKTKKPSAEAVKALQEKVLEAQTKSENLSRQAYRYLKSLLKAGQDQGDTHRDLGLCAMKFGKFDLASGHFKDAIDRGDHESWIHRSDAISFCDGPTSKSVYSSVVFKRQAQNLIEGGMLKGKVAQDFQRTLTEVASKVRGLQVDLGQAQARGIGVVMDKRDHVLIAAYEGLFEGSPLACIRVSRYLADDAEHDLAAEAACRSYKLKPSLDALKCFCGNMKVLEKTETKEYYEQLKEMEPQFAHLEDPLGYLVCASYCNSHGDREEEKRFLLSALIVGQGTEKVWEFLARMAKTDDELLGKLTAYLERKSDIHGLEQLGRQLSLTDKSEVAKKLLLQAQEMGSDFATLCLVYQRYLILERERTTLAQYFIEHPEQLKIDEKILQSHMTHEAPRVACLARMLLRQFYGQKKDLALADAYAMRGFYMQVGEVWHELVKFQLDNGRFTLGEIQVLQSDLKYDGDDPQLSRFKKEAQNMHAELQNRDTPLTPWEQQFLDAANNPDSFPEGLKILPHPGEPVGLAILASDGPPSNALIVSAQPPSNPSSASSSDNLEEVGDEKAPPKTDSSGSTEGWEMVEEENAELEKPRRPDSWGDWMEGIDKGIEYATEDYSWTKV